jgi:hypothetical protein
VVYFLNIHSFAGAASNSLNPSLVAEIIRRCNSRSAAIPPIPPRALALALDWPQPDQEQEQETNLDLRMFSEKKSCFSEFSRFDRGPPYPGFGHRKLETEKFQVPVESLNGMPAEGSGWELRLNLRPGGFAQ